MTIGYKLPGTTITEVTQPSSVNTTSSQRRPCFIGVAATTVKVVEESVIRSSTGLADSLLYTTSGIASVTYAGRQKGLKDLIEGTDFNLTGDQIVFTSSGILTVGATYFVTYYYTRPASDYKYKEFTNYEDVVNDLGDDIPANKLVNIAKLALKYYNVPSIGVVQVPAETSTDYANALDLIKYRDVQTVQCLTTNSTVRSTLIAHINERSLPSNKRERVTYLGTAIGTTLGDDSDPASIRGISFAIKNERVQMINATRATYYYNDPTTKAELTTTVDGSMIAAAVAAYRDSFSHPTTSLLNRTIPGLDLFVEDFDDYYSEYKLTLAGSSSVYLIAPSALGGMLVIDDLTTDNTTVERNNTNIITAKDYVCKDVRYQMDRTFKGSLIKNRPSYQRVVFNYLTLLFTAYKTNNVIEETGTLTVTLPTTRRDTVNIFYSYYAVYTHKYTEGTYSIEL
jgi:hypothetical protein